MEVISKQLNRVQTGFLKPPFSFMLLLGLLTLYQRHYDILDQFLEVPWLSGLVILFHMTSVIVLMALYNISYYMFIRDHKVGSLIYSAGFSVALTAYLIHLLIDFGGPGLLESPVNVSSGLLAGGHLVFFLSALAAEWIPSDRKFILKQEKLAKILPLVPAVLTILVVLILYQSSINNPVTAEISKLLSLTMDYFSAVVVLLLMMMAFRHAYIDDDYRYLGVVVGYVSLFFSKGFAILSFNYGAGAPFLSILLSLTGYALLLLEFYRKGIGDPLNDIEMKEKQIALYANNLDRVIQKRTKEIFDRNRKFETELEYARNIQQSLLPEQRFAIKNAAFVTGYFPCEDLSGDFYDIYRIDDDHVGMYILDVSGHGISAALMTMFCNNYIKSTERLIKRYRGLKPHKNLSNFYEEFNRMNFPDEMHMVIFFAAYCLSDKTLTYCSGGMNCQPFIISRDGKFKTLDESLGFPICKFSDLYKPEYQSATVELSPGDRVVFYTDGLIDMDKNRVMDQVGLEEFMSDHVELSLKALNERLIGRIYPKMDKLKDDISYFIMEIE
ncbi:MAG: SpoIIE family protein phosphatase [Acidaminobacter sp.]|uniref:PP2C family protein-serine/threonine phosphatase n=1 Tax=Acidaminobacter sp. TaxID=1872102 RepID=UPI00138354D1|nr:SpoIIE family protein phosphatase [Acidaminobacter sp.]MZQ97285.1 SpoIIE family protein phosphatase [Acidaminobacter sp.]